MFFAKVATLAKWLILGCVFFGVEGSAQTQEQTFSGESTVKGLGKIAFPKGNWHLDAANTKSPSGSPKRPDAFVFQRDNPTTERLTFLRYKPTIAPPLSHLLDFLGESLGTGIPRDSSKQQITGTHYSLRTEPSDVKRVDTHLAYSFVFDELNGSPRWLCHCLLFNTNGWVFVIVHTSSSVNTPEVSQEIFFKSSFETN